jgi:hypothetical protein
LDTELINDQLLTQIDLDLKAFANIIERPSPDTWVIELKEYDFLGFISCEDKWYKYIRKEELIMNYEKIKDSLVIADMPSGGMLRLIEKLRRDNPGISEAELNKKIKEHLGATNKDGHKA